VAAAIEGAVSEEQRRGLFLAVSLVLVLMLLVGDQIVMPEAST